MPVCSNYAKNYASIIYKGPSVRFTIPEHPKRNPEPKEVDHAMEIKKYDFLPFK